MSQKGTESGEKRFPVEDDVDRCPVNFCHFLPTNCWGNIFLNLKRFLAENVIINYQ